MIKEVKQFINLAEEVQALITSTVSWKTKYDLLFTDDFAARIKSTGIRVEWVNPDADYEGGVMAYAIAIADKAVELRNAGLVYDGELPYIIKMETMYTKHHNPDYGDDKICKCGHSYCRHFDTHDNMAAVGCKYCDCFEFEKGA